jgi:hypothetical protein
MKISLIIIIIFVLLIISQDTNEMAMPLMVNTSFPASDYANTPFLDSQNRIVNNNSTNRLHEPFKYTSPESWQPMTSSTMQQAAMLNVPGRANISGIPSVPTGVPPYIYDIQPFNLTK